MPFGLANAPAAFQSFVNEIFFRYIDEFVIIYLDDILIYSQNVESHKKHLFMVFQKLKENNLFVKLEKCEFFKSELEFLGYQITVDGLAIAPSKVSAIQDWPVPNSKRKVRGFLGLVGFSRKFIKELSTLANPLTDLTKDKVPFIWS